MQRKFITNLAFLVFVNVLIKPFWIFGIDRTVQNMVGAGSYGLYFSLLNFSVIFSIFLDLGITNYNNRKIAQHHGLLGEYLSNILIIRLLLAVFFLALSLGAGFWLNFSPLQMKLLLFLSLNQALSSLILYLRSNVSALHHFRTDSILSVLDKTLMIVLCSVLIWGNIFDAPFHIEWYVYVQTIAYAITSIVSLSVVLSYTEKFSFKFEWKVFTSIMRETLPFASIMLLMAIYNKVDAVMLERMLGSNGSREAGIYASAYRLIDALNMIGFLFSVPLLPIFSKMLKQQEKVDNLVELSFKLIFVFSITIAVTSYFFRLEIMTLLYHEANEYSAKIFGLLLFAFVGMATVYIFGTLLIANNNIFITNGIMLSAVIINVALNYWLIPLYHALGAAVATLCTQSFVALFNFLYARRALKFGISPKLTGLLLLYAVIIFAASFFLKNIFSSWLINFAFIILSSVITAFVLRLIDLKKITQLARQAGVQ